MHAQESPSSRERAQRPSDQHERVFVYGSLKRGQRHHAEMVGATWEGDALLEGYYLVLYEDSYPALVRAVLEQSSCEVHGEAYWVTPDHLRRLDSFEDVPELYQRREVVLADGRRALAYVIEEQRALVYQRISGNYQR